jgi:hypothetical protein
MIEIPTALLYILPKKGDFIKALLACRTNLIRELVNEYGCLGKKRL